MDNKGLPRINPHDQIILFDGVCKLCNRWSRFIVRFDSQRHFKLCTVQSATGQSILKQLGYPLDHFETMLLVRGDKVFIKSDAFIEIARQLPMPWSWIKVVKIFPQKFRDWFYDRIALNRYRLFGKYEACVLPSPDDEQRFI